MIKAFLITLQLLLATAYGYILFNGAVFTYEFGYLYLYQGLIVLLLPILLVTSFKRSFISGPIGAFLYVNYLLLYVFAYFISDQFNIGMTEVLNIVTILLVLVFNLVLMIKIVKGEGEFIKKMTIAIAFISMAFFIFLGIFTITRPVGSVVALDYVQHEGVVALMKEGEQLCITPNQCSNVFLKHGYTTTYHSIIGFMGRFSDTQPSIEHFSTFYYLTDIIFAFVSLLLLFYTFYKVLKDPLLATGFALVAILTFVAGSYDFAFFLPQNLALLLFLIAIQGLIPANVVTATKVEDSETAVVTTQKPNFAFIALSIFALFLSHFVMGAYLAILLIVIYIATSTRKISQFFAITAFIAMLLTLGASFLNFSIEATLQASELELLGGSTSHGFPSNLILLAQTFGLLALIPAFIALSGMFIRANQKKGNLYIFVTVFLLIVAVFFLAPTYSSKFLLAGSTFLLLSIAELLTVMGIKPRTTALILLSMMISTVFSYNANVNQYNSFYTNERGDINLYTPTDEAIIRKIDALNLEGRCTVVSDPYTQHLITGFTSTQSLNGVYTPLEIRQSINEFWSNPNQTSLDTITEYAIETDTQGAAQLCFVYTPRLDRSTQDLGTGWLTNMYLFDIKGSTVSKTRYEKGVEFLTEQGFELIYTDNSIAILER